jgi:hypothetical protein
MPNNYRTLIALSLVSIVLAVPGTLLMAGVWSFGGQFQPFIVVILFLLLFAMPFAFPPPQLEEDSNGKAS